MATIADTPDQHTPPPSPLHTLLGVLLACGLLLVRPAAMEAKTYHVSKSGNDGHSCASATSVTLAKRTIMNAVTCLQPGDTLYIRAGVYPEALFLRLFGTASQRITLAGYPGDPRPVLRPTGSDNGVVVNFFNPSGATTGTDAYVNFHDIDIDMTNMPSTYDTTCIGVYTGYVTIERTLCLNAGRTGVFFGPFGHHGIFRNNIVRNAGRYQPFDAGDTKGPCMYTADAYQLIEDNLLEGCRAGGITFNYDGSNHIVFQRNIIRNFAGSSPWGCVSTDWGGQATYGPRGTSGSGIIFAGAGVTSVPTGGPHGPSNVRAINNIIYNGSTASCPIGGDAQCFAFGGTDGIPGPNIIAHNTCDRVDQQFFSGCGTANTNLVIQNNIMSRTVRLGPMCGAFTGTIDHNLLNPDVTATFVDANAGDYRLKSGSPAINAGIAYPSVQEDFLHALRPQPTGGALDVGAYAFGGGIPPIEPPANELRASYLFENSGLDTSTFGNTLTLVGRPTFGTGHEGQGLTLDGGAQYATAADAASLDLTTGMSLVAWVRPSTTLSGFRAIVVKDYVFFLYASSSFYCAPNAILAGFVDGTGLIRTICAPQTVPVGSWTHLAGTYDGTALRLYVNGSLVATTTPPASTAIQISSRLLYVGSSPYGEYFPGTLDDVGIYSYALSASQIAALAVGASTHRSQRKALPK